MVVGEAVIKTGFLMAGRIHATNNNNKKGERERI